MAINVAAVGIRNGSRFFTDDDDDGIGQLADADSRPVPRPQFRRQGPIGGQRKEAAGCHNTVFTDNDGPVVKGRIGNKNIAQELL